MGKPTICIGENKDADQLISAFVFATRIVQFLFYLNPKFQAFSSFLCLYRPVCVGPPRKPHCWFSHEAAQIKEYNILLIHNARLSLTNLHGPIHITLYPPKRPTPYAPMAPTRTPQTLIHPHDPNPYRP